MGVGEWRGGGWYFGSPVGNKQEGKASMLKPPPPTTTKSFHDIPLAKAYAHFHRKSAHCLPRPHSGSFTFDC